MSHKKHPRLESLLCEAGLSGSVLQRLLNGQRRQVAQEYRLSAPELEALVSVEATTFENLAQALQDWMNERRLSAS
jgi:hypothetical protein